MRDAALPASIDDRRAWLEGRPEPIVSTPGAGDSSNAAMRPAKFASMVVVKADDAPAPSIVICGLDLRGRPERDVVAAWMAPSRARAMASREELGAKTVVLLNGPSGLEVEFFQGLSDRSFEMTAETCVNSAACAAAAAVTWGASSAEMVDLIMAGSTYRFEIAA